MAEPERKESRWIRCLSSSGQIRGVAVQATELVQELVTRHKLKRAGAVGLGESLVGALYLASYCKTGERINLNIRGSGAVKQAIVDAYPDGRIRGYVIEQEPLDAILEKTGPWGEGVLSVLKTKDQQGERPYIGTVPLLTGHLAKDLTFYWHQSEQVPTAVGIAVEMSSDDVVKAAGGFMVQLLPQASESEILELEKRVNAFSDLAERVAKGEDPMQLLSALIQDQSFAILEERPISFSCSCSKERVERALALLPNDELHQMRIEDGKAIVNCEFCSAEYIISRTELQGIQDKKSDKKKKTAR